MEKKNYLLWKKRQFEKKSKEKKMTCIGKDIDYFSKKYSLIELFHGICMSYSQINGCNEVQKKFFQYYIYCYSEPCYGLEIS